MINVCYCGNKGIFHGIALSALSVAEHTEESITVYILTMELVEMDAKYKAITAEQAAALDKLVKLKNPENSVLLSDFTEYYRQHLLGGKNGKNMFTPYACLRLFMDLPEGFPDRIIYLDADTMCCSDIKQLWDIDVENYEFAAVLDKVGHVFVKSSYCNSGVLLLNMKKIRQTGLFRRCRERVYKRKMFMPDQSAMNFLCESKLILPYKFNEQRKLKGDTVIKHFCKGWLWIGPFFYIYNYKQWERDKVHKKLKTDAFDKIYELYDRYDDELAITKSCKD